MINNFDEVNIKGGYFDDFCQIKFHETKKEEIIDSRVVLIYGENGSGKSSIAESLYNLQASEDELYDVKFNSRGKEIYSKNDVKENIYVYEEKFVDQQVKYASNGLKAIVMFGKQVEVDQIIEEEKIKREELSSELERERENSEALSNEVEKVFDLLKKDLQENGGWADLDREIKAHGQKTAVTKSNIKLLFQDMNLIQNREIRDLKIDFEEKMKFFREHKKGIVSFKKTIDNININNKDIIEVVQLLENEYKKPIENETLSWFENEFRERGIKFYQDVYEDMDSEDTKKCPYCTQSINKQVKESVLFELNSLMDNTLKELDSSLGRHIGSVGLLVQSEIKQSNYKDLGEDILINIELINKDIRLFNKFIEELKSNIKEKREMPYKKITVAIYNLDVEQEINNVNKIVNKYNANIEDIEKTKSELIKLNKMIMQKEFIGTYEGYITKCEDLKKLEDEIRNLDKDIVAIDEIIEKQKQKKKNTAIALTQINEYLSFIFWDKKRLELKPSSNGDYEVWSRKSQVDLSKLSIGERNIISLCYFFSKVRENQNITVATEKLIVIDDPISSFDAQNKIGMLSFLRNRFYHLLKENSVNKFIILTHDAFTAIQLGKIFEDINSQEKNIVKNHMMYELRDKNLKKFNPRKYDNMTQLICSLSYYAFGDEDMSIYEMNVGNMLRRVLEAYSNFNYKIEVAKVFNTPEIMNVINENRRGYYEHKMYRLLLHGESHTEDQTKSGSYFESTSFIGSEEKKNLTKDTLAFLYELDTFFVKRHVSSVSDFSEQKLNETSVIKQIESHIENIAVIMLT